MENKICLIIIPYTLSKFSQVPLPMCLLIPVRYFAIYQNWPKTYNDREEETIPDLTTTINNPSPKDNRSPTSSPLLSIPELMMNSDTNMIMNPKHQSHTLYHILELTRIIKYSIFSHLEGAWICQRNISIKCLKSGVSNYRPLLITLGPRLHYIPC